MLPLQQAREVRTSVLEYIKATFPFKDQDVSDAFYRFIEDRDNGLFKGPYISLKTPFVSATNEESHAIPLEIKPDFSPYKHQLQAFRQLTTHDGHKPEPTLLTTGTGSGKTECFLYPVLDYCYRCNKHGRQPGVKVIILYPMNALASDQAKRLAETIWNDPRLKDTVTAGLFVGEGEDADKYPDKMGEHNIIEKRSAIIDSLPDIILTNFKMLDYGLMRQKFMPLWKGNIDTDNKLLKFLVLDELHTYDGAQGTDVANLIRRLKLKLGLEEGALCPVGTSATLGNGEDSRQRLCDYASNVFGENFSIDNVIEEHRISVDDYMSDKSTFLPNAQLLKECELKPGESVESYMRRLRKIWLRNPDDSPISAGEKLRQMQIVKLMVSVLSTGIKDCDQLRRELEEIREYRAYSEKQQFLIIENLLALIAYAKRPRPNSDKTDPLLFLQVQLWQRELSGILRYVQEEPEFVWRGSLDKDDDRVALPMYFCRECGASGWVSLRRQTDDKFHSNVSAINTAFMDGDKDVMLLNVESVRHEPVDDYLSGNTMTETVHLNKQDLRVEDKASSDNVRLRVCAKTTETKGGNQKFAKTCPECNSQNTVSLIGGRTSTLSSVAVSQILASDFDTADVSKRKLLVFSNSVQDAAHQAGFYEARTFRFLFRQSMQQYINSLGDTIITLSELQRGFKKYWHKRLDENEYYARFLPEDLAKHIDLNKNYRDASGDFMPEFKEEFEHRVDWEIATEFGLRAHLGRTLERTGSSASFFREEDIKCVYTLMKEWLVENKFDLISDKEREFATFVYGILQRMRIHGAIDHPYLSKYREEALTLWALNWTLDNRHFLNRIFGFNVKFPKLPGTVIVGNNGDMLDLAVVRRSKQRNWYNSYYFSVFADPWVADDSLKFNDFIKRLFDVMVEVGLLNRAPQGGGNYAINPDKLWISAHVKHIKCDSCQSTLYVAQEDVVGEDKVKCFNYKCSGTYSRVSKPTENYYQQVYSRALSPRVHAHEHTGLLERSDREKLEKDFKDHPNSNSVNVLSATSTLEMGIDIGDLNVTGNTSIPPKPANFIQRVGRAGRKEGDALILNYAHMDAPHDMYYFTYPLEMMEGEVTAPGCFLEAKDILRRHFFAYCIDSWTSASASNMLPRSIKDTRIADNAIFNSDLFILNRLIEYIKANIKNLEGKFRSQYGVDVQPAINQLFDSVANESFYQQLFREFVSLKDQLAHLEGELTQLKEDKSKIPATDKVRRDAIDELIRATNKQKWILLDTDFIEFMTNVGLLPNYAFPETGVKLDAYIMSRKEKGDAETNKPEPQTIELMRPASQGIRELAPGNSFYTQRYRLSISGLSTFDWKDCLTKMRYCSKCDCMALDGEPGFNKVACPKCLDPSWGANQHPVLKLTNSRSVMYAQDANLDDASEERDSQQYIVKKHFMFNHHGTPVSYAIRDIGFGIEYCNNMKLFEVNYGMQLQSGPTTEVNGDNKIHTPGFVTCRHCGKSTPLLSLNSSAEKQHYKFCKIANVGYAEDPKQFEELFLYRSMTTEAIKVLLPVQIMEAGPIVEMFKAGVERGMNAYFASSADHIRIDSYTEINQITGSKDSYLVLYDTIPGGTGYLTKLFNTTEFNRLLAEAYNLIHDCECQYTGKDGCYHCILTYGNQYRREEFSRQEADELFRQLVNLSNSWERIEGHVGSVAEDGGVEDSELEKKFVRVLSKIAQNRDWEFEEVADVDKNYYKLTVRDKETKTEIAYHVVPQFNLNVAYGVPHHTISDFQIICKEATINGIQQSVETLPMWAIYLDGFTYHVAAPNLRFYGDFEKREGIKNSQSHKMASWTLTWEDIQLFEAGQHDIIGSNNVERLISMLTSPSEASQYDTVSQWIYPDVLSHSGTLFTSEVNLDETALDSLGEDASDEDVVTAYRTALSHSINITPNLDVIDKEEWISFWRIYNLLQFFPSNISSADVATETIPDRETIKLYYPGLEGIVDELLDAGVKFSYEGDVDLIDAEGMVIASAEMIIPDPMVALDPIDKNSEEIFKSLGYRIIAKEEFNINSIKNLK